MATGHTPTGKVPIPLRALLTTDRLTLRRFTRADVDNLVSLDADPQVMRYLTGGVPTPREVVESTVLPAILAEYERGPVGKWAATADSVFVGWFALDPRTPGDAREVELGYRLRTSAWGSGLATEGSLALVDMAFRELGSHRVWAETMSVNHRSRRVMEKAGLRYVRTFHLDWDNPIPGTEEGEVEYELLRAEWIRNSGNQSPQHS
ncbi:GNAT family N-acetyltransferase [Actinokineospora auranticolor]|nr:GNAT family N-acetyltransferase [Actinokineospora auranticolor]